MRIFITLLLAAIASTSCKTTERDFAVIKVNNGDRQLFTMQVRESPPRNCCVCASDSAFDNIDLSNPENYCTEHFASYENFCNALIIGPRNVSLPDIKEAVVDRLGENACSGHLYYQTHGHSGTETIRRPLAEIRLCITGNCLPEKLTLITTGCQAHKEPREVEELLQSLAEDTGIAHIESWGNQTFDPGPAGMDWTMSKVAVIDGRSEFEYWNCKSPGTNCTMLGTYHHHMGWRCKAENGDLQAQFCCPSATREGKWDWASPVAMEEDLVLPPPSCPGESMQPME